MFEETIRSEHVVVFLSHLIRCVPGNILIVWDRLSSHRSGLVRDYLDTLQGRVIIEYLPPYAPELNPVEYIWAYLKQHQLPNVCAKDLWNLGFGARQAMRRMRRKPHLITAFWKQSTLYP